MPTITEQYFDPKEEAQTLQNLINTGKVAFEELSDEEKEVLNSKSDYKIGVHSTPNNSEVIYLQEKLNSLQVANNNLLADLEVEKTVIPKINSSNKPFWRSKKVLVTFVGLVAIIISEQFGVSQGSINSVLEFVIQFIPETAMASIVAYYLKNQSDIDKEDIKAKKNA